MSDDPVDVLVVGAGPTGLTLAAQLAAHGIRPRLVDRSRDRVNESRALAIQPRTLEVLAGLGITDRLVALGNAAVQLRLHTGHREVAVPLFDIGLADTAYPYLLFLSQAETERILSDHLTTSGMTVERGVTLTGLRAGRDAVTAMLRHGDGSAEQISARYVVGCDGAHSSVRAAVGIGFAGSSYPQTFVLADTEADGITPDAAHAFLSEQGMLFFFPLGAPASWRLLVMRPPGDATPPDAPVTLDKVQALTDAYTRGTVRLHDPVWTTNFRLHHRAAAHYRAGRVFLAGDAAHIHSPAGAQGMNTGIQDAVNLGWKLAHSLRGVAHPSVMDTYEPERAPVGRMVLRFTDRAFTIATSTNPLVRFARTRIAPAIIPLVLKPKIGRSYAFRSVSQLGIRYRTSPLSLNGPHAPRHGPKAGDRLPDAPVFLDGQTSTLHNALTPPGWHVVLCGPTDTWPAAELTEIHHQHPNLVTVHRLSVSNEPDVLHDPNERALRRLGLASGDTAMYLVRPDGHIGYRSGGHSLSGLINYLGRWMPPSTSTPSTRPASPRAEPHGQRDAP
ncbi:MAG TPA: FAD-dependent monooxygenase [Jiangellaceae bacterium]|jgi:2-polyprenyl-6-methoxyphenol hydroxylase-like FAD-dependent oxidoreductase|nr:FAD-dependent monooxygenase [Jiangellaceae bacterium]